MTLVTRKYSESKGWKIAVDVCRILLALTFVFSGFVKTVDPWGTGIKVGEYLAAFDMDWLYGWRFGIGIWLNGAEMMLGLMVLFKVRLRLTTIFISCAMLFFTCLSFVLAIWNPVDDCGCFGEAIKLTNWETFIKNLRNRETPVEEFDAMLWLSMVKRVTVEAEGKMRFTFANDMEIVC